MTSNAKGDLIARLVSLGLGVPTFEAQTSGPAHERLFRVTVSAGSQELGAGEAKTRKEAERMASEQALGRLENRSGSAEAQVTAGPWPIYAQVLAQAVEAALELASDDATLQDIQDDAAQFYRGLLAELGHGPEAAP